MILRFSARPADSDGSGGCRSRTQLGTRPGAVNVLSRRGVDPVLVHGARYVPHHDLFIPSDLSARNSSLQRVLRRIFASGVCQRSTSVTKLSIRSDLSRILRYCFRSCSRVDDAGKCVGGCVVVSCRRSTGSVGRGSFVRVHVAVASLCAISTQVLSRGWLIRSFQRWSR